ncbi:MAG: hypothetical protein DRJ03_04125 [Chloroflexi bacterium]|nr:MAG: hypothetical protein DRJ03_04125 [Chloroflexota bacterium]
MLLKQTLKILKELLTKCEVTEVRITESEEVVHCETDEPEFDIKIVQNLRHWQIQAIDEVLADFPNVEIEFDFREGLMIFEVEKKEDC